MPTDEAQRWLEEHGSALYSFALLHLRDPDRAEDAVQETLLAALQALQRFAGNASIRTWLLGILKHKIVDEFRRQAREAPVSEPDGRSWETLEATRIEAEFAENGRWHHALTDWGDPEQVASSHELWSLVEQCLESLSPRMARLFMLRDVWEADTTVVCEELAMTPTNVWTSLHRARLAMRRCLERSGLG